LGSSRLNLMEGRKAPRNKGGARIFETPDSRGEVFLSRRRESNGQQGGTGGSGTWSDLLRGGKGDCNDSRGRENFFSHAPKPDTPRIIPARDLISDEQGEKRRRKLQGSDYFPEDNIVAGALGTKTPAVPEGNVKRGPAMATLLRVTPSTAGKVVPRAH